jgi:hypothetical protein
MYLVQSKIPYGDNGCVQRCFMYASLEEIECDWKNLRILDANDGVYLHSFQEYGASSFCIGTVELAIKKFNEQKRKIGEPANDGYVASDNGTLYYDGFDDAGDFGSLDSLDNCDHNCENCYGCDDPIPEKERKSKKSRKMLVRDPNDEKDQKRSFDFVLDLYIENEINSKTLKEMMEEVQDLPDL